MYGMNLKGKGGGGGLNALQNKNTLDSTTLTNLNTNSYYNTTCKY
jgi:hypothetical protein